MQTFIDKYGAKLLTAIGQHIVYVVISVLIAAVIGIWLLAVFLSRFRKAAGIIMPLVSVFQTIPGIVFIGVLMLKMGMTLWNCSYGIEYLRSLSNPQKFLSGFSEYRSELHGGGQGLRNEQMADVLASGISDGTSGDLFRNPHVADLHRELGDSGGDDRPGRDLENLYTVGLMPM